MYSIVSCCCNHPKQRVDNRSFRRFYLESSLSNKWVPVSKTVRYKQFIRLCLSPDSLFPRRNVIRCELLRAERRRVERLCVNPTRDNLPSHICNMFSRGHLCVTQRKEIWLGRLPCNAIHGTLQMHRQYRAFPCRSIRALRQTSSSAMRAI